MTEKRHHLVDDRSSYQKREQYSESIKKKIDTVLQVFHREKRAQLINGIPLDSRAQHGLPSAYKETYVYLLPVDPVTLFVVWEFNPRNIETVKRKQKGAEMTRYIVRLYEETAETSVSGEVATCRVHSDIEAHEGPGETFFTLSQPGRYHAELGVVFSHGEFIPMQRTDSVETPGSPAESHGLQWMKIESDTGNLTENEHL